MSGRNVVAPDDLQTALKALLVASSEPTPTVREEAAAVAAVVSRNSPSAATAWADAFDSRPSRFDDAVQVGKQFTAAPTPTLLRLLAEDTEAATRYARALAELAIAAASLGELTISAIATATVLGNVQLLASGTHIPTPGLFAAPAPDRPTFDAPGNAPSAAGATAPEGPAAAPAPPAKTLEELLAELDELVGLDSVKTDVRHQTQVLRIQGLRVAAGLKVPDMTRHLVFVGNPGTGKTTVARLVAGIYRAIGVLAKGHLVECDRSELVAGYLGQTALKTSEVIASAIGGALFIDEAYALAHDEFGGEAIDTLVKEMEDHREELVVIVAGYPGPMHEFITSNPGLESRFRLTLTFDDYSDDQLVEIFCRLAAATDFVPTSDTVARLREILAATPRGEGFGNGRFVRTMFESAVVRQAWRLRDVTAPDVEQLRALLPADLTDATPDPTKLVAPTET
jgi:AAA lid domain/ATPase family associated with various cellular activities (AAA)